MKPYLLAGLVFFSGCTSMVTRTEINAPASVVRSVLFDYADYPKWNPYIVRIDGTVEAGAQVYLTVQPLGSPQINAYAKIVSVKTNELAWLGTGESQIESGTVTLAVPGVFTAKHRFIIEELGAKRTVFLNNVDFSGAAVPFRDFKPMRAGLDEMNEALKRRAEEQAR